jgi:hypothetical protein
MKITKTTGCKQTEKCGKWSFDATVDLSFVITYLRDPNSRSADTPGATLREHEFLHVQDLQGWCSGLESQYPSEGFDTFPECNEPRNRFFSEVQDSFQDAADESTRRRDRQ